MSTTTQGCSERVFGLWDRHGHTCTKPAKVQRGKLWFCAQHDPEQEAKKAGAETFYVAEYESKTTYTNDDDEEGTTLRFIKVWLKKWERAEERLKKAQSEMRSARAALRAFRCTEGYLREVMFLNTRYAVASDELRCAEADVVKKKDSFAFCTRWLMEGRQL